MCALLAFALLHVAPASHAKDAMPEEEDARRLGVAALPRVLAHVDADDPDIRMRARALARRIALDHYAARAPEGMRLVPGRVVITIRDVTCEGFYLGTCEVTLAEFREFVRTSGMKDGWGAVDARAEQRGGAAGASAADADGRLPATDVSLDEARAFAAARGARLPTQAELDRAAHAGGRLRYPWGDRFDPARVNSREAGRGRAEPVGSRKDGLSADGIADLLGNVAEWTETPADRSRFVVAGGSYRWYAQTAPPPYKLEPSARLPDVGFRLAKSLPPLLTPAPE